MTERQQYTVEIRKGWSYVVGPEIPEWSGPWRYQWEAQEEADRPNAAVTVGEKTRED
jgi:hypothetical protein